LHAIVFAARARVADRGVDDPFSSSRGDESVTSDDCIEARTSLHRDDRHGDNSLARAHRVLRVLLLGYERLSRQGRRVALRSPRRGHAGV